MPLFLLRPPLEASTIAWEEEREERVFCKRVRSGERGVDRDIRERGEKERPMLRQKTRSFCAFEGVCKVKAEKRNVRTLHGTNFSGAM